jgi:DNA-binding IclR family transcriptional regulator
LIRGKLQRFTPNTITSMKAYRQGLEEIRRRGYSLDEEEIDIGINAVGVPVFNREDEAIAAVVVAGLAQRITGDADSDVVVRTRQTAHEISERLHHKGGILDGQRKAV